MGDTSEPAPRQWPVSLALPLPDFSRHERLPGFPSQMPVSSALRAAVELIDEDLEVQWDDPVRHALRPDLTQLFFMGVTGEAFAFLWFPKGAERPPLDPTLYWPDPGALYQRALTAAGFTCEVLGLLRKWWRRGDCPATGRVAARSGTVPRWWWPSQQPHSLGSADGVGAPLGFRRLDDGGTLPSAGSCEPDRGMPTVPGPGCPSLLGGRLAAGRGTGGRRVGRAGGAARSARHHSGATDRG